MSILASVFLVGFVFVLLLGGIAILAAGGGK